MATVTAGQLIVAGLRRADMEDSPTGFIEHPASGGGEAFDYLNASLSELFDLIYENVAGAYSAQANTFNTVAGQSPYPLDTIAGTTFYHLMAVEYWDGQRWIDLYRINLADRDNFPQPGVPYGYALEGGNVVIYPAPAAVYPMRIRFEILPPTASADADVLNLQGPWREFVELHFAVQCLEKEESETGTLVNRLYGTGSSPGGLAARIRASAAKRDAGKPTAPVDVQSGNAFMEPWLMRWF